MNSGVFQEILSAHIQPNASELIGRHFTVQMDNDRKELCRCPNFCGPVQIICSVSPDLAVSLPPTFLPRSSGSVSVLDDSGNEVEVKLRKSKKRRKPGTRSSMNFITEEKESLSILDSKRLSKKQEFRSDTNLSEPSEESSLASINSRSLPTIPGLPLSVANGSEEIESARSRRDSKSMSVCLPSDRTHDRRSKGVINLIFKTRLGSKSEDGKAAPDAASEKSSTRF